MITIYPYETLGHVDHGWLDARHHFSFGHYHDRNRMGFGVLRVINDDVIAAGRGFGIHPHNNMEIITYVRSGAITHKDNRGNEGKTLAGDVQVMSAGTGIFHGEINRESVATRLYQIWITPSEQDVEPRWESKTFPKTPVENALPVLVSGRSEHAGADALFIHQDAAIYGGNMLKNTRICQPIKYQAYILASEGEFTVNGKLLKKGDGAEVTDEKTLTLQADTDAQIVIIDVPA